jgi:hypothetical protein
MAMAPSTAPEAEQIPVARQRTDDGFPPARFVVRPWIDPLVEEHGFPVNSPYTETVILPILGPATTFCLRRLGTWVAAEPDGVTVDTVRLASDLGLGHGVSRHSPMGRTLDRLCRFGMAKWCGGDMLVRTAVAPATERQLVRLSPMVVQVHRSMVGVDRS